MVAAIDWTNVLLALIAAIPGIIAAVYAGRVHKQIKTPSGTSVGSQIEDALHVALANNMHLRAVAGKVDAPAPPAAASEEALVPKLTEGEGV